MKKIAIPAILAAAVLVAGMFAFIPVQKASTVHTAITAAGLVVKTVATTAALSNPFDPFFSDIDLSCDKDFVITSFRVATTHDNALDDFEITSYFNNGRTLDGQTTVDPAANVDINNDLISNIGTNVGVKAGTTFRVVLVQSAAGGAADGIAVGDAAATVLTTNDAVCSLIAHVD